MRGSQARQVCSLGTAGAVCAALAPCLTVRHRSLPQDGKFHLILVESRIHRLARYYKKTRKLPPNWK